MGARGRILAPRNLLVLKKFDFEGLRRRRRERRYTNIKKVRASRVRSLRELQSQNHLSFSFSLFSSLLFSLLSSLSISLLFFTRRRRSFLFSPLFSRTARSTPRLFSLSLRLSTRRTCCAVNAFHRRCYWWRRKAQNEWSESGNR